jgi:hypothetical protein
MDLFIEYATIFLLIAHFILSERFLPITFLPIKRFFLVFEILNHNLASGVRTRPRLSCLRISPADNEDAVDVIASRLRHLHLPTAGGAPRNAYFPRGIDPRLYRASPRSASVPNKILVLLIHRRNDDGAEEFSKEFHDI